MPHLFGEKLERLRRQQSLTQAELARKIGLAAHSHIAKLEGGEAPSLGVLLRIADTLNVSTDYLLRDTIPVEGPVPPLMPTALDEQAIPFSDRLRELRLHRHLSQRQLADLLGVASRAYIGGLEAGNGKLPSLELVVRIADLFEVSTDYLLQGSLHLNSGQG
jgi:transcriptional regulator with XRE-family HTH domain